VLVVFGEPEANARAFEALARFLDLLDETPRVVARPELDQLVLSFQLKLLWLSGYLPHVTACVECGACDELTGFSARAGGAVCASHAAGSFALSAEGLAGIERLLSTPLADAAGAGLGDRARRDALAVITSSYEEHGGFRLRSLSA
jgi:DNA repair protein RecO (recombination protein O)